MIQKNIEKLKKIISGYNSLAVAFSGGGDSALLTYVSFLVLGERMMAIYVKSPFSIEREYVFAGEFVRKYNIPYMFIEANPLEQIDIIRNDSLRCYYCKKIIFKEILKAAAENGFMAVADGSNLDDLKDYRPGKKALEELGVVSPLMEAGFTKKTIKEAGEYLKIENPFKSSNACLASRIPYGIEITADLLKTIHLGEDYLYKMGFNPVRLRINRDTVRLELSEDGINRLLKNKQLKEKIVDMLKKLGFIYITLDLEGFRSGSLNLTIGEKPEK